MYLYKSWYSSWGFWTQYRSNNFKFQTQYGDLEDKLVLDAGCGPGNLSIGASLLGAGSVTAVDIDNDALEVFKGNVNEMEVPNVDALQCDFLNENSCRYSILKSLRVNCWYLNYWYLYQPIYNNCKPFIWLPFW